MSQKFVGLDMKTYSNFRDFVYGLRSVGITSEDDEFTEARVLRALHECSERIDKSSVGAGNTILITCRSRIDARNNNYLEARVSNSHRPDKFVCLNLLAEDDQVVVRENVLETMAELPEFMGNIKGIGQSQAYAVIMAHKSKFDVYSLRFFEGIDKEFMDDSIRSQFVVNISDTAAGCIVSWYLGGMVIFTITMQRVIKDTRAKVPLTFGTKGAVKA